MFVVLTQHYILSGFSVAENIGVHLFVESNDHLFADQQRRSTQVPCWPKDKFKNLFLGEFRFLQVHCNDFLAFGGDKF